MLPDEKSGSLCSWDSRNSDRNRLLALGFFIINFFLFYLNNNLFINKFVLFFFLGHTAPTRAFVHSPTMPAFITGSDDCRARFWFRKL